MFSKEKGKTWKVTNAILLLYLLILVIAFLGGLITSLLPEGGDYSTFDSMQFLNDFLVSLLSIGIIGGTLYVINRKVNLFDKTYPFSRKFLNFCFVMGISSYLILFGACIIALICQQPLQEIIDMVGYELKDIIATFIAYTTMAIVVNVRPIMIRSNSKALNFINFVSIWVCLGTIMAFILSILNYADYTTTVDLVRTLLIEAIVCLVFGLLIYFLNFRNKENTNNTPQAFNANK